LGKQIVPYESASLSSAAKYVESPGSHHGGQIIKLLQCDLWVDWTPTDDPAGAEFDRLCGFKQKAGHLPFGNEYPGAKEKRVRVAG
jgi:hypothetical protein